MSAHLYGIYLLVAIPRWFCTFDCIARIRFRIFRGMADKRWCHDATNHPILCELVSLDPGGSTRNCNLWPADRENVWLEALQTPTLGATTTTAVSISSWIVPECVVGHWHICICSIRSPNVAIRVFVDTTALPTCFACVQNILNGFHMIRGRNSSPVLLKNSRITIYWNIAKLFGEIENRALKLTHLDYCLQTGIEIRAQLRFCCATWILE